MTGSERSFSAQLRSWRKAIGLKQEALAYELGVTQPAISRWEAGLDMPSTGLMIRLRDMMAVSDDMRRKIDSFAVSQLRSLHASFDLDGIRLIDSSLGMKKAWPSFTALSGMRLMDHLVDEAAFLMHDDDFVRDIRRGEVAMVSAISVNQLSLGIDSSFKHRWFATFRSYGTKLVINMTYEPCEAGALLGVEHIVRLDAFME